MKRIGFQRDACAMFLRRDRRQRYVGASYRLAPACQFPAAADDIGQAIEHVRSHAAEYKVDPKRIALLGESAGGHLVS